ncbi:MAG TPA: PD-(D/E)XK nuclease family protein [Fimbriiglobus sp.]
MVEFAFRSDPTAMPLDEIRRRILIGQAIEDVGKSWKYFGRIGDTRGFVDRAAGTIDDLKRLGFSGHMPKVEGRLADVGRLFAAFEKRRLATGLNSPEDQLLRAAAVWRSDKPIAFKDLRVVVVERFVDFSEPQKKLIEAISNRVDIVAVSLPAEGDPALAGWVRNLGPGEDIDIVHVGDSAAVELMEAPGHIGEARMVARRIRKLQASGTSPGDIVVTARDWETSADMFAEVFDEYAIPVHGFPATPLGRAPAVAFFLQAWRVPSRGFSFSDVAAILRSIFFRLPGFDPDLPLKAETLLRKIGGPDGKENFLRSVDRWAESPPLPLEDETAEAGTRRRTHELARTCRPFLNSFFALWDGIPSNAKPEKWVERIRKFARVCGLETNANPNDTSAIDVLWEGLAAWSGTASPVKPLPAAALTSALDAITSAATVPVAPPAEPAVRILTAENARFADCDYLFLTGLEEGLFPNLAPPESLLTDADRVFLRGAGLSIPDPADRRPAEQALFNDLLARPRLRLVLSYPAVDEKGREKLPSSFLAEWREQNPDVETKKQMMLIQDYAAGEIYSDAERRVRYANSLVRGITDKSETGLPVPVVENLKRVQQIARARFDGKAFGRFDGGIRPEFLNANLDLLGRGHVFEPGHVFSPSGLETYVACPFRFWLERVLGVAPLDDPPDAVERTRHGSAIHRAMARYHLAGPSPDDPKSVASGVRSQFDAAVAEYQARSGGSVPAAMWDLERLRLHRTANRYPEQWQSFRAKESKTGPTPVPRLFEATFGLTSTDERPSGPPLVLSLNGLEVRIGGTVDRIDTADVPDGLGFWIVDYKSGRGSYYTGTAVANLDALQLPLYALAAERVLFPGQPARLLGLAYWLVSHTGSKSVLPKMAWDQFRNQLERWVVDLVTYIRRGAFPLAPRSKTCTATCPHGPVCRIAQHRNSGKRFDLSLPIADGPDEVG